MKRIWPCTRCAAGRGPPSTGSADGTSWAPTPRSTKCCWPPPNSGCTTPHATCCRAPIELDEHRLAHRVPVLAGGHHLRRHRRNAAQHHRAPAAGPREGMSVDADQICTGFRIASVTRRRTAQDDAVDLRRRAGHGAGRAGLGRHAGGDARSGDTAGVPAAGRNRFARLGSQRRRVDETIGGLPGGTPPLPYAGGGWVVWERTEKRQLDARVGCRCAGCPTAS